ncbi:MAG: TonB dependent receptor [Bacteroidetes bacterium ADurb.Bin408]|nr:MAG: TonB dependent receptor [Bacteroidetes bacterium ADurb.Bin408]
MQTIQSNDTAYSNNIVTGLLANFSYNAGKFGKLSFKNQLNINTEDKVVIRSGIRDFSQDIQTLEKGSLRSFTENKLYSGQLSGEHFIGKNNIRIKWMGSYSNINRSIPNLRRMIYTKAHDINQNDRGADDDYMAAIAPSGTSPSMGGNMFFSQNNEKTYNARTDISKSLKILSKLSEFKAGYYYQQRHRVFSSRQFGFSRYNKGNRIVFDKDLLSLPENQIFNPENLGEISPYIPAEGGNPAVKGVGGFKLEEVTKLNDSYVANAYLNAGYLMSDNRLGKKFRVIWGMRMENYRQTLESFEDDGDTVSLNNTVLDILPSVNAIYALNDKSNIRLSFAQTVSRPEFRELAPFGFFDYTTLYSVRGNPDLKRATVKNFDIRYETYPTGGQVVSVSLFYKNFTDAIEQVNRADVPRELCYQNVAHVMNAGIELEYRLNLATVLNNSDKDFLNQTTVFSNVAFIKSEVDTREIQGAISNSRPLQGQSPYVLNAGVQYYDRDKGWGTSLVFNQTGRRIAIVGNLQEPDTWENPSPILDFQLSKSLGRFDIKINFKDLLASKSIFYQDLNNNKKFDRDSDNLMAETSYGRSVSIGINYKINK